MTAQVKNVAGDRLGQSAGEPLTLAELQNAVTAIAKDIATIAEKRGQDLKDTAEAGTNALRRNIRRQPAVAMGVATLAGVLLALLAVPARRQRASRWSEWTSPVTRADLEDVADSVRRSLTRAASAVPVTPAFERLVDALTRVDAGASLSSVIDKAGSWLERVRSKAS
jgi:hypothetical protein